MTNVSKQKKKVSKEAIKNLLSMIRTDCWDEIPEKELIMICDNYRIEATDLLETCHWLFRISNELEKLCKEKRNNEKR